MNDSTATLVELRKHYQTVVAESELKAADARVQIAHIDALLVNGLIQSHAPTGAIAPAEPPTLVLAPVVDAESAFQEATSEIAVPEAKPKSRAQPPHQPKPNAAERSKKSTTSSPLQEGGISLLPVYEGLNKLEAIVKVLSDRSGRALHRDTIIQLLYGDVSPDKLTEVRRKMRASLFQGTLKGLWQKAPKERSSYWIPVSVSSKPQVIAKTPPVAPETIPSTPVAEGKGKVKRAVERKLSATARKTRTKSSTRGRAQVLALPPQYEGLSKIDAVAKVLQENPGQVMHIDTIIKNLYGELTPELIAAEKVRMKDVMKRGIERKLWQKAPGIPSSIVLGESRASGRDQRKPRTAVRKPRASAKSK